MSLVETTLVSGGTAAVVTMLIEYTAKPYLEARKNRIVDRRKAQRSLSTTLASMHSEVDALQLLFIPGPGHEVAVAAFGRLQGYAVDIVNQVIRMDPSPNRCSSVFLESINKIGLLVLLLELSVQKYKRLM
ncbi:hypothetical protein [Amycolatopsis sp. NPDC004169]|uniref:hypothetical protein n=1 Tax=Amycolatopsis sp. NPDC004169 TaxID=3154453 RepID=UPI0033B548D5